MWWCRARSIARPRDAGEPRLREVGVQGEDARELAGAHHLDAHRIGEAQALIGEAPHQRSMVVRSSRASA